MMTKYITQQQLFEFLFQPEALLDTFNTKYAETKVRGYDALTGKHLSNDAEAVFETVAQKCADSSFRFTPYKEKLILKGRDSAPRMASIPTVRDRVVLKHINEFLKKCIPEVRVQNKPRKSILPIIELLKNNASADMWVYGGDLKNFFDTISHERLLSVLAKRIEVQEVLNLIRHALQTPTLPVNTPKGKHHRYANTVGVPQGISIAGTLAAIYLLEVDERMSSKHSGVHYCRYVDDILLLGKQEGVKGAQSTLYNSVKDLGLELHSGAKETLAPITTQFQFLGFLFKLRSDNKLAISVRISSVNRVYARLLSIIKNKGYCFESNTFDFNLFLLKLNVRITGFVMEGSKEYRGWLSYYNQINDLELLYQFDSIVKNKLIEHGLDKYIDMSKVKSFVRAYQESRYALHDGNYIPKFTDKEVQEYGILDDLDEALYRNF